MCIKCYVEFLCKITLEGNEIAELTEMLHNCNEIG